MPSTPPIASDYLGDTIAVIDESVQTAGPGVYYVLAVVWVRDAQRVINALTTLRGDRSRPFHWSKEGVAIRGGLCHLVVQMGLTATVWWSSTGRKGQLDARIQMLGEAALEAVAQGTTHMIIESSDDTTDARDRAKFRDIERIGAADLGFHYEHRTKIEQLLALADAIAGATGEYLIGSSSDFYERLAAAGAVDLRTI